MSGHEGSNRVPLSEESPRRVLWAILAAVTITTLGTLPVFLLSAQAVLVSEDLGLSEFELGMAVTAFFAAAAGSSLPAGRQVERLGQRNSVLIASSLAAVSLVGIALVQLSYVTLLAFLVLGGVANAAAQISANLLLAQVIPTRRQGLAFGVKQSAIPVSTLVGGLAVPAVGLTLGWRWSYAFAGTAALLVAFITPMAIRASNVRQRSSRTTVHISPTGPLVLIATATGLGSAALNAMGAFIVVWAVRVGLEPGPAGLLLAGASALSIAARIASGIAADRRGRRNLPIVAGQLAIGAICLVVLSTGGPTALVVGTLLAFGIGWSWPGLLLLAVVKTSPGQPAVATSIIQVGAFLGGASGPGLFGLLTHASSFVIAWRVAAGFLLLASCLIVLGRHLLIKDLNGRVVAPNT